MRKKLVVRRAGGLGNQLFQYAAGRSFASSNNMDLVLDNISGFKRDFQYGRSYSLSAFDVQGRLASYHERIPFQFQRLLKRYRLSGGDWTVSWMVIGDFLEEGSLNGGSKRYVSDVASRLFSKSTWVEGYWQSDKYFANISPSLKCELMPPSPMKGRISELGAVMQQQNSAAICIRLYEESINPQRHCRDGVIKSPGRVRQVIDQMMAELNLDCLYLFCSHESEYLKAIGEGLPVYFVTPENSFQSELDTLWLMMQCRHHLITNSSFYWWGAWLADMHWSGGYERVVYCADNFINIDSVRDNWRTF